MNLINHCLANQVPISRSSTHLEDYDVTTSNLQDQNNTGPTQVFNIMVGNNLQSQNNTSITGGGNTAGGQKQGQCVSF
jgi:hypothetical protein